MTKSLVHLTKYKAALRAVAAARSTDELKSIHSVARAIIAAGKIAENRDIENDGKEIRLRAERRLGELMEEQKATVGLNKGGRPSKKTGLSENPVSAKPTLQEAGIDKNLAQASREASALPAAAFEDKIIALKTRPRKATTNTPNAAASNNSPHPDHINKLIRHLTDYLHDQCKLVESSKTLKLVIDWLAAPDSDLGKVDGPAIEDLKIELRRYAAVIDGICQKLPARADEAAANDAEPEVH